MNEWLMLLFTRSLIYITGQVLSAIVIGIVALFFFFSVSLRSQILLQWARFNIWTLTSHLRDSVPGQGCGKYPG